MTKASMTGAGSAKAPAKPAKGRAAELSEADLRKVSGGKPAATSDVTTKYNQMLNNVANNIKG